MSSHKRYDFFLVTHPLSSTNFCYRYIHQVTTFLLVVSSFLLYLYFVVMCTLRSLLVHNDWGTQIPGPWRRGLETRKGHQLLTNLSIHYHILSQIQHPRRLNSTRRHKYLKVKSCHSLFEWTCTCTMSIGHLHRTCFIMWRSQLQAPGKVRN